MKNKKTQVMRHDFVEMYWIKKDYDLIPISLIWGLIRFDWKKKVGEEMIPTGLCSVCEKPKDLH